MVNKAINSNEKYNKLCYKFLHNCINEHPELSIEELLAILRESRMDNYYETSQDTYNRWVKNWKLFEH